MFRKIFVKQLSAENNFVRFKACLFLAKKHKKVGEAFFSMRQFNSSTALSSFALAFFC
jgi:hypothetical protein